MTLTIYEFDKQRVYTGVSKQPGPRDPIPRNWTHIAPPDGEGYHIFDGVKWFTREEYPHPLQQEQPPVTILTRLQFRQRFTLVERATIEEAKPNDAVLRVLMEDLNSAEFIDLNEPSIEEGILYLTQLGIITSERGQEILGREFSAPEPEEVE